MQRTSPRQNRQPEVDERISSNK
ncbi:hypothetical protein B4U79_00937 [Dinothrombium tinctorium]|uniref:Uncharacterized protein n=1 Tax=Dinothrombium tinctorium TaxID=1965070 RepID=A0A3S3NWA1_9ACAR|nr:hypothetical protein B4U79_00937 [Dinothrombium tinctorium]